MEIAYVVNPRPDTGLWNAKIAIWLFIASEVMLFGGLFSGYVFLRIGAAPGMWPHGLLDVRWGTINTMILISSSITAVFAWAAVKMRKFSEYKLWMGVTILLGVLFLCIKLGVEYPAKFKHFGAYIKQDSLSKYEAQLGNKELSDKNLPPRYEITGHLEKITIDPYDADPDALAAIIKSHGLHADAEGTNETIELNSPADFYAIKNAPGKITNPEEKDPAKWIRKPDGVAIDSYIVAMDPANADPSAVDNDHPHFIQPEHTDKIVTIKADDVDFASMFVPKHSTFLAIYFTITILHALHIVGGLIVFTYFFTPFGSALYKKNPEHFANRIEVSCIYWHFVDLVWIFAFPVFYLL